MKKHLLAGWIVFTMIFSSSISVVATEPAASQEIVSDGEKGGELEIAVPFHTFDTIDGRTVTSKADGKPKVLIFFGTRCPNSRNTMSSIKNSDWIGNGDADIVAVDAQGSSKEQVEAFKGSYGCDMIDFCYGPLGGNIAMQYVALCSDDNPGALPYIFYIDSNHKIRSWTDGAQSESSIAAHISNIIEAGDSSDNPFVDVPEGAWYEDAVLWAYGDNIMSGKGNNKFDPAGTTTRAEIVQILYNMSGMPAVSGSGNFTDVASSAWYADAVIWAVQNNITAGVSSTRFAPRQSVARQEMAALLYRYARKMGLDISGKNDLSSFHDSDQIAGWALEAMQWANYAGIINGKSGGKSDPQGTATRAEIAVMIRGFMTAYNL